MSRLWDSVSGCELLTFSGHVGQVRSVASSPNGRALSSESGDKTMTHGEWSKGR